MSDKDNEELVGDIMEPIPTPLLDQLLRDSKPFDWKLTPVQERNAQRRMKVWKGYQLLHKHLPWLNMPIISFVFGFWFCILDEGIISTCKPRWGALTFGYLNDGFKPTLWHTWRELTRKQGDPYTGIYPEGAPKSLKQAQEWQKKWKNEIS